MTLKWPISSLVSSFEVDKTTDMLVDRSYKVKMADLEPRFEYDVKMADLEPRFEFRSRQNKTDAISQKFSDAVLLNCLFEL